LSDAGYNIDEGSKDYLEGASKFKPVKVELKVSNAKGQMKSITGSTKLQINMQILL
jgi:hypothetical protein